MTDRARVNHNGSIEEIQTEEDQSDSSSDNVEITSERSNSISFKGDTIQIGDLEIQKVDVLLILLILNIGVNIYG